MISNLNNTVKNLFIINPNAGTKQALHYLPQISDIFDEAGGKNDVQLTSKRGDGTRIVTERGMFADRIICVGGDGTLSEVISGIKHNNLNVPIGYIPAGSTNDFANSMNLSKNILQAARDIINGGISLLDVGKLGGRYFCYVASFGAFTKVSYSTPQSSKNTLGHLAYIIEGIKELPNIRPEYIKIETANKKIEGEYIFGAVINSTSLGGVLTINPETVNMSDGLFEILLIKPLNNPIEVWGCAYSLMSQNYDSERISFFKADRAVIYANPDMKWSLDGEFSDGGEKIEVENLHKAVKIITNNGKDK